MKKSTLKKCEEKLREMRSEVIASMKSRAAESLIIETDVQDEGDMAQESSSKAVSLLLIDKDKIRLTQINQALDRIADDSYGICIDTEEEIEERRLLANPLAMRSIIAQENFEKLQKQKALAKRGGGVNSDFSDD